MDEAISSLATFKTLTEREIEVPKKRFGVKIIDFENLEDEWLGPNGSNDSGAAPTVISGDTDSGTEPGTSDSAGG